MPHASCPLPLASATSLPPPRASPRLFGFRWLSADRGRMREGVVALGRLG
eukprot:CAMPEP_0182570864 /NCGR_PEP_ID=MMETSP1324-20130603/11046_1 /TAXON_ID=236786 /ORGANISM="Florenciella sp., Strain RCC1587" /LENGTH=49 /DNA_ID= /DNA_START= /DNA_END= /DNA_ORIENTATION=